MTKKWVNEDGLIVLFGNKGASVAKSGATPLAGNLHEIVIKITGTDVPTADAVVELLPTVGIPNGAKIADATLYVTTAFTGSSSTLDIGTFNDDGDGTYSANDADGIDAAIALAALTVDAVIACDGAQVGDQAGASRIVGTGDRDVYVSTGWNTAAFTAGEADLVIHYRLQ